MEIWEQTFQKNNKLWGDEITLSAYMALDYFKANNLTTILVAGVGYGRNAKLFIDNNLEVDGIEISPTALEIAKHLDFNNLYLGDVTAMPYSSQIYDAIYAHALIHLLDQSSRTVLINKAYSQLKTGGTFIFTTVVENEMQTRNTTKISENTYQNKAGINVYMYNEQTLKTDLQQFKDITIEIINENKDKDNGRYFYYVSAIK